MALSLFAIRNRTKRRSSQQIGNKSKYNNQRNTALLARRYWKEGEEQLQQTPQTYVNLVQMLMPHPKSSSTNLQQQF
ncbi:hypothetical protein Mgra_00003194 [Meloidogyne graminicola]|uniref:Uncharacterized protein n=1 Tax=Meloidogyne graminicola TaxID=189291 RepID=A0A8S9ZWZ2_9BILA|nr:hypothetical protein Mgra_00003194 [Meloidogyne graminicola]